MWSNGTKECSLIKKLPRSLVSHGSAPFRFFPISKLQRRKKRKRKKRKKKRRRKRKRKKRKRRKNKRRTSLRKRKNLRKKKNQKRRNSPKRNKTKRKKKNLTLKKKRNLMLKKRKLTPSNCFPNHLLTLMIGRENSATHLIKLQLLTNFGENSITRVGLFGKFITSNTKVKELLVIWLATWKMDI